jgi:CubicO group peptidase (beta-lactamase class C family)
MSHRLLVTAATAVIVALPSRLTAQPAARDITLVKHVFARWDSTTGPGCSVGIDRAGQPRYTRAFGEADLEYDIPNKPETIFEAGSISKQFTAAATVLLALDGKLKLEDDVRKYVPELPAYERPITIRHLLNHTSGLRDWGEVAALAGWPRETRVHTHDHVLDILSRQRALNYPPGDKYSYTNSGYNLLAIIVSRVSGQPFATFSRERLFKPLGLTSTQWRDDFRRIVKGRAQAYMRPNSGQWQLEMPFENVHGNGGLLTTVSDLLTWTAMLEHPTPQWKPMVDSMHVRGRLTNGDTIDYAL